MPVSLAELAEHPFLWVIFKDFNRFQHPKNGETWKKHGLNQL
jgi:hypothetical protein